jgi:hypothetical protein
MSSKSVLAAAIIALICMPVAAAMAQTAPLTPDAPSYKPPLRGAPGGRVGGASRGITVTAPLTIELIAPENHAGQTAEPSPTLYYFVSRAVSEPMTLTISVPAVAKPVIEARVQLPGSAGIQPVRLADYRVQLQPGINYSWSISLGIDPRAPSRDIVATASIMRVAPDPAVDSAARAAAPLHRAAVLAQAGLWYDAVAAAVDAEASNGHAALDSLLDQVGLDEPAKVDRQLAGGH